VAGIRPTSARVREALFDILGARTSGAAFLDLYAGTGAVGLEALSRGAARVVLIEQKRGAVRAIAANAALLSGLGEAEIIEDDARAALRRLAARGDRFGIVFLDPPWDEPLPGDLLGAAAWLLPPGGVLVLEHRAGRPAPLPDDPDFAAGRSYRHGDASLSLLHRAATGG